MGKQLRRYELSAIVAARVQMKLAIESFCCRTYIKVAYIVVLFAYGIVRPLAGFVLQRERAISIQK